ncbi:hypothetical protein HDU98_000762 [Podochytrium sp. JEL0797]|nr:hypothetical protein HDU98_000762 [Podochytrium sp. JEL0797]
MYVTSSAIAYASTQHKLRFASPIKFMRMLLLLISGPMLSIQIRVACFEFEPKIKDLTCRPHSRLDAVYIVFRTVLTIITLVLILYGVDPNDAQHTIANWIMCITCAVFSGALAYGYIWIVTIPMVFMLAAFLCSSRKLMIENMPVTSITDPFTLELKCRFILMREGLLYPSFTSEASSKMGKSPGDIGYVAPTSGITGGDPAAAKETAVLTEVNGIYVQAAKEMPKSCMLQIMMGTFQLVYLKNRAQCLAGTTKASQMRPLIDEKFMLFKRQRDLNEKAIGSDGVDFIAYERHLANAKKNERRAAVSIIQFWSELMKRSPSIHKLEHYGSAITSAISSGRNSYLALIKLSPHSPNVFRMYGSFLMHILNDTKKGQELIDHAEEIEEAAQRERGLTSELENDDDLATPDQEDMNMFSDDNGLITISGEKQNLCHITNANAMALKLFGYKKHELVGKNVSKIIPNPFSVLHDELVQKYLDTGLAKVIDRVRQVLGINSEGYLFQFVLCVKHIVDPEGKQSFAGIVKPANKCKANSGFAIVSADFKIQHATHEVSKILGIRARQSNEFDLKQIFPTISHDNLTDRQGTKGSWTAADTEKYEIEFFGNVIPLNGSKCYICRIKFKIMGFDGLKAGSTTELKPENIDLPPNHGSYRKSAIAGGGCPFVNLGPTVQVDVQQPQQPYRRASTMIDTTRGQPKLSNFTALNRPKDKDEAQGRARHGSISSKSGIKNKYETQLRMTVTKKNEQISQRLKVVHGIFQVLFAVLIGLSIYSNLQFNAIFNGVTFALATLADYSASASFNDMIYNPRMTYILTNGPSFGVELMNLSTTRALQTYNTFVNGQGNSVALLSSIGPILAFIVLVSLFPVHILIEIKRKEFLAMFFDIPKQVVKGIYQTRLAQMIDNKANQSDSEEDDDEFSPEIGLDGMIGSIESLGNESSIFVKSSTGEVKEPFSLVKAHHKYLFDKRGIGIKVLEIRYIGRDSAWR